MNKKKKDFLLTCFVTFLAAVVAVFVLSDRNSGTDGVFKKEKFSVAMGTVVSQKLYSENESSDLTAEVERVITDLEKEISWRTENSTVFLLNENGSGKLSPVLKECLTVCRDVYEKSGGSFDVTVGGLTSLWDIGGDNPYVPAKEEIKALLPFVNSSEMMINGTDFSFRTGQKLDLGAVGKGLACDMVREYLQKTDTCGAVVSVGGSILLYGESPKKETFSVAVRDPRGDSNDYMGTLCLKECCVSTSGDYERIFVSGGKTYHHILDPKTGYPAQSGLISVTVVCDSGLLSDALSTACFVLGKDKGEKLLSEYSAEGIFIDENKNVYLTEGLRDSFTLIGSEYTLSEEKG